MGFFHRHEQHVDIVDVADGVDAMSARDLPRIFQGSGLTVMRNALGNQLSWKPSATWRHPWFTQGLWNPALKAWTGSVVAGLVNGKPPLVAMTVGTAPQVTIERLKANKSTLDFTNPAAAVQVPLTDNPTMIPLSFRNIGVDDPTGNAVPPFFQKMVAKAVPFDPDNPLQSTVPQNLSPNNRLLRACDFFVQQPRYWLDAQMATGPETVGYANLQTSLVVQPPPAGSMLQLIPTAQYEPVTANLDQDTGIYTDPAFDTQLVSTLYLLSPPGAAPGSAPDGSWTQYPQHTCFWNLSWSQNTKINQPPPADLSFIIALPSGILLAQGLVNEILGSVNDAYDEANAALTSQSLAGQFWTLGGSQPLPAPAPVAVSNFALNKAARNAAAAQAAKAAPAPLDPAFPYTGITFPTQFL